MVTAGAVSKSRILTQPLRFVRMAKMQGAETEDEGSAFRRKARMSIATRQIGHYYTPACARVYMVHSVAGLCYGVIVKAMIFNEKKAGKQAFEIQISWQENISRGKVSYIIDNDQILL